MAHRLRPHLRVSTLLTAVILGVCSCGFLLQSSAQEKSPSESAAADPATKIIAAEFLRSTKLPGRSRSPLYGRKFAVTSGQPTATSVGMQILRGGGNAADAAVAMALTLSVVEPMRSGPGGDVSILYWDEKAKRLFGLESSGLAPQKLAASLRGPASTDAPKVGTADTPTTVDGAKEKSLLVPTAGPLTWSTPGAVDGWAALHGRFGSMPWEELFAPAISLANDGFVLSPVVANDWNEAISRLSGPGAGALKPSDEPLQPGFVVKNADYARTLQTLASDGRDSFYEGDLGQTLVAFGKGLNAALSLEDLAKHQATWHEPITIGYRDTVVATLPASSTGVSVLETLGLLAAYNLREMGRGSAQFWHLLLEAKRLAVADVMSAASAENVQFLTAEHLATTRRQIDPNKGTESAPVGSTTAMAHTSAFIVTDAAGNTCVLVQDLGQLFGSGIVPGAMGFVMQGRAAGLPEAGFTGKLPHGRALATVSSDGVPVAFTTADSGTGTTELMVQTVTSLVDFQSDPQTVVDAARLLEFGENGVRRIVIEPGINLDAIKKLESRGHVVTRPKLTDPSTDMGEVQLIVRPSPGVTRGSESVISAGTDPRRDGSALAE